MDNYDISIVNSQSFVEVDEELLRGVVLRTLSEEHVSEAEISIAVVDNAAIHVLNRRYLQHDEPTDVLSFPLGPEPFETDDIATTGVRASSGSEKVIEGEIVLSGQMAAQVARQMRSGAQAEMILYLIHGILHLCGYDDRTDSERDVMRRRERVLAGLWDFMPVDPAFAGPKSDNARNGGAEEVSGAET